MARRIVMQASQRSVFPVLLVVTEDEAAGRTTLHPLPLDWTLLWRWLIWYWLPVALAATSRRWQELCCAIVRRGRAQGAAAIAGLRLRLELEIRMTAILTRATLTG